MTCFDDAKLCKLVNSCILHILGENGKHTAGCNHGLACFENTSGPHADRVKNDFIKIFEEDFNLCIICKTKIKVDNVLDAILNVITSKYQPYHKPDNSF